MNDGISVNDVAWIQRDQFLHYINGARRDGDPDDWASFRLVLADALDAAFGFEGADTPCPDAHRRAALDVVDRSRATSDPVSCWASFVDGVWAGRREIRPDLL